MKPGAGRRRRVPGPEGNGGVHGGASLGAEELMAAFAGAPGAMALAEGGAVIAANQAFALALGLAPGECGGRRLLELLPPDAGTADLPGPGRTARWRTHLGAVLARVESRGLAVRRRRLTVVAVVPESEEGDSAASLALLDLSRALALARSEEDVCHGVARAMEMLFPGRSTCLRLLDPATLALTTLYARGRIKPASRERVALKRTAVRLRATRSREAGLMRPRA